MFPTNLRFFSNLALLILNQINNSMKKILLIMVTMFTLSLASAQLPDNSYAPDFTATDINGVTHNLYALLDSGYTVVLDLSAAWCGPCWTVHQSGILQDLHDTYGPNGTNEMRIFYIESEGTNGLDQLYGLNSTNGGGANRATDSYGDWVGTHTFPFIDNATIASAYQLTAFPTLYAICPERLTRVFVGSPAPSLAEFYAIATACEGPATTTIDPSLLNYSGEELAYCSSFDGAVTMQNHGTSALTSATIELKQGANVLATQNWTGNLASYQVATVNFPGVVFSPGIGITAEITSMDNNTANNDVSFTVDVLALAGNAIVEDMEDGTTQVLPSGVFLDSGSDFQPIAIEKSDLNNPPAQDLGGFGASVKSLLFLFFNESATDKGSVVFDKLAIPASADEASLEFSYAYAQYNTENDRLQIEVSSDCGATWSNVFDKAGSTLSTTAATQSFFIPAVADWVSDSVDLSAFIGEEILVRFVGTSAYGNNLYVDDVNVSHKTAGVVSGINDIEFNSELSLSPVPASTNLNVAFELGAEQDIELNIVSVDGKVISSQAFVNTQNVNTTFDVASVENGVYFMIISTENGMSTRKFVVSHN